MPKGPRIWDAMHFRSLELGNVCAFGSSQSLQLVNEDGGVSRWNLILGENGVGKTTLMRALAVMRPVPAYGQPPESPNAPPNVSSAELSECEDESDITRFIRRNGLTKTTMTATLETEARVELNVGVTITTVNGKLEKI